MVLNQDIISDLRCVSEIILRCEQVEVGSASVGRELTFT